MQFDIVTIFPSMFSSYFQESIIGRARKNKLIEINIHNLRDYTTNKHGKVDDTPYGGGAGMVLQVEPIFRCVSAIKKELKKTRVILFSAKGKKYTQTVAKRLSKYNKLILICGRYEGVDERVAENIADEEISIGDYVLTGGELPAMILVDSVSRFLPGVLGNNESINDESHNISGYLEYPQYSKPKKFQNWNVPEVLLCGDHGKIKKWRKEFYKHKNKCG